MTESARSAAVRNPLPEIYAERGDVCIGFTECRCAKCLASPSQQDAKRRLAKIRGANRG